MIIRCKIDVTKISKEHIFQGAKGKYIDITLLENKNGTDQYDNDFMVVQDIGKEARERGEKGPILGNGKYVGQKPVTQTSGPQSTRPPAATRGPVATVMKPSEDLDQDVPF